jgi:hypothetical protein
MDESPENCANRFINELLRRKEALLKAALDYNAIAGKVHQEVMAIDFEHDAGQTCRIMVKEYSKSSDTVKKYIVTKTFNDLVLGEGDFKFRKIKDEMPDL